MIGALVLFGFGFLIYYVVSAGTKAGIESAFGTGDRSYTKETTAFTYEKTVVSSEPTKPTQRSERDQREFEEALHISRMAIVRNVIREATELHNNGELSDSEFNALVDQAIATGYLRNK